MAYKPKTVELRPVKIASDDFDAMEVYLRDIFKREIYAPLMEILNEPPSKLQNSMSDVIAAIRRGTLYFSRGQFKGQFSAKISAELKRQGAKWDYKNKSYRIPKVDLSMGLRQAVSASEVALSDTIKKIDKRVQQILPDEVAASFKGQPYFDSALHKTDDELRSSMKAITVQPKLTDVQRAKIAEDYTNNMRLFIRDFTQEQIKSLRKEIEANVFKGARRESMVKSIQDSYDVSANKAKFLARQETSLMMTTFKETRYKQAGVNRYKWHSVTGSALHPVRPAHKALADLSKKGDTFSWDDPPITTEPGEPVRRNNPGQDYNCRCFAIPVVDFTEKE